MGTNWKAVGNNLVELNRRCDCQRKEINHLKEQEDNLRDGLVGVNHNLKLSNTRLDRVEERRCRCGETPSDIESLVS